MRGRNDEQEGVRVMGAGYGSDWRERAACADADPELFFPIGEEGSPGYDAAVSRALAYCARCPVRQACLDDAVLSENTFGVFGGTTPEERRVAMRDSTHIADGTVGDRRTSIPDYAPGWIERYRADYGRTPGRGVRAAGTARGAVCVARERRA